MDLRSYLDEHGSDYCTRPLEDDFEEKGEYHGREWEDEI